MPDTIVIGSDHAGFELKEGLKRFLGKKGYDVIDEGTNSHESVDYPDYGFRVAGKIRGRVKGILVCGSGIGMSIAANRVRGVRAALVEDEEMARLARQHNDANVLCLSGRRLTLGKAGRIADVFLKTPFSNEPRHARRVKKLG